MNIKQFRAKNQFVINNNKNIYFHSYNSTVARITDTGGLVLGRDWDYSQTTLKYLYMFLNDYKNEIKSDIYKYITKLNDQPNKKEYLNNLIKNKIIKYNINL